MVAAMLCIADGAVAQVVMSGRPLSDPDTSSSATCFQVTTPDGRGDATIHVVWRSVPRNRVISLDLSRTGQVLEFLDLWTGDTMNERIQMDLRGKYPVIVASGDAWIYPDSMVIDRAYAIADQLRNRCTILNPADFGK